MTVITYYQSDEIEAKLQYEGGEVFLHCEVSKPSLKNIKILKRLIKQLKEEREQIGYDRPLFSYTQNPQFAKLMGGVYLTSFEESGKTFEVWMWE